MSKEEKLIAIYHKYIKEIMNLNKNNIKDYC